MPSWPTLYPALHTGKVNTTFDSRPRDLLFKEEAEKDRLADTNALTER